VIDLGGNRESREIRSTRCGSSSALAFHATWRPYSTAFQVLNEWPNGGRGADHHAALEACRAALTGSNVTLRAKAFEAFVHDRNILAPDALAVTANKFAGGEWLRT
jgi:hypothetical protein